jgi:hypothetical protein
LAISSTPGVRHFIGRQDIEVKLPFLFVIW